LVIFWIILFIIAQSHGAPVSKHFMSRNSLSKPFEGRARSMARFAPDRPVAVVVAVLQAQIFIYFWVHFSLCIFRFEKLPVLFWQGRSSLLGSAAAVRNPENQNKPLLLSARKAQNTQSTLVKARITRDNK